MEFSLTSTNKRKQILNIFEPPIFTKVLYTYLHLHTLYANMIISLSISILVNNNILNFIIGILHVSLH